MTIGCLLVCLFLYALSQPLSLSFIVTYAIMYRNWYSSLETFNSDGDFHLKGRNEEFCLRGIFPGAMFLRVYQRLMSWEYANRISRSKQLGQLAISAWLNTLTILWRLAEINRVPMERSQSSLASQVFVRLVARLVRWISIVPIVSVVYLWPSFPKSRVAGWQ